MSTLVLNADGNPMTILPLMVLPWNEAIKLFYLDKVDIVDFYEDWEVHSPSVTMSVPSIVMTRDFFNISKTVKFNRDNILLRDDYTCQYCSFNGYYDQKLLTMDHVNPRYHNGPTKWDNITVACQECNTKKGHNANIKPAKLPYIPSYYQLAKKRKNYPVHIHDEKWIDYLDWDADKIFLSKPNKI